MGTRSIISAIALALAATTGSAAAQPSESVAQAEQLFEQARTLFDHGDYAAACPRFEASYKLDPALGTLLNLATCHEKLGAIASAWGRYREVVAIAKKTGDVTRYDIAVERAAALEPRLPRLTIAAPPKSVPGLQVTRDDVAVDLAVLGAAIYVDPGEHVVTATADGRKPFTARVTLAEAEATTIQLPALAVDPDRPKPAGAIKEIHVVEDGALDPGRNRRIVAIALGGTGIATIATGLGFGLSARSSWQSAFDDGLCDETTRLCTREGQERTSAARRNALVADVVTGVGVGLVVTGVILYVTAPKRGHVSLEPVPGGVAVSLGGGW
jgi:hypothetical protein